MKKDKKSLGFGLITILILVILIFRIFFLLSLGGDQDNSYVFEQNHSMCNGTYPEIIAERFAEALNESPIKF